VELPLIFPKFIGNGLALCSMIPRVDDLEDDPDVETSD
jgi:hypothetical protein